MLERVMNHPDYKDVLIYEDWRYRSKFEEWMKGQDWIDKDLDKDILSVNGLREYGPQTCIFIDSKLNKFFNDQRKTNSSYPLGVRLHDKSYSARCWYKGKRYNLGAYDTPSSAHKAWQEFKYKAICEIASDKALDERLRLGLERVAAKIKFEFDNNIETTGYWN